MKNERRSFLFQMSAGLVLARSVPSWAARAARHRPTVEAVMSGDVSGRSGVVWARTDRPCRLLVDWDTTHRFRSPRRARGSVTLAATAYAAQVELTKLPPGQVVHFRVRAQDLRDASKVSEPAIGRLFTPSSRPSDVRFAFSGDQVGQGFGIDEGRGGMSIFSTIAAREPQFFIHLGDRVYADQPLEEKLRLPDGTTWNNIVTPAKAKVAESLDEFRGQYAYNLMDHHYRRFLAKTPIVVAWDDHEVRDNWFPGRRLDDDPRYREKSADLLAARGARACLEFAPIRTSSAHPYRIYRSLSFGPRVDVFVLDARTHRAPNSANRQASPGPATAILGRQQVDWLKAGLRRSTATWKVIACDVPLGLMVPDGDVRQEGVANGEGPPMGREHEFAGLFSFLGRERIGNVIFLTADVHYAAAHRYHPSGGVYQGLAPVWEFVAGPLHAGGFGPNSLDPTFGPELVYCNVEAGKGGLRVPSDRSQTFGEVDVDGRTGRLTVRLLDRAGHLLFTRSLAPR